MSQLIAPFVEGKYGWNYGESGWNSGMDENLVKFSFLFDRNIDAIVSSLPASVSGTAYYLSTDKRVYFSVNNTYYSSPVPKWFTLIVKSTGQTYQFNGTDLLSVSTGTQVETRLSSVEGTINSLGTAAFQPTSAFATSAQLDVVSAQANSYTDTLRTNLFSTTGTSLVGHSYISPTKILISDILNGLTVPATANGALGNGTDETSLLQSVISFLPSGATIDGLGKTFTVTKLLLKSNMRMRNIKLVTKANASPFDCPITIDGTGSAKSNIILEDVEINGNRSNQTSIVTPSAEDGGLHGIRVVGFCSNLYLNRVKVYAAGSYGILLFSSISAGPTDNTFVFNNIVIRDSSFNGCRAHGGASDSTFNFRFISVDLKDNGNDLAGSSGDPLTSGTRGARSAGNLYGTGWDFEGYGLGSAVAELYLLKVVALGNARNGILFFDQLDNRPAGFVARQKIWISDCYFDKGLDPASDGTALTFSSTITSKTLAPLYSQVYINNTRLDGSLTLRGCDNIQINGEVVHSTTAFYSLLDYATNIVLNVTTPGSSKSVNSSNSTWVSSKSSAISAGNPVLSLLSGTGTLGSIVVTPIGGTKGQYYRYSISAQWTGSAAGSPLFRITPAASGTLAYAPRFEIINSSTLIAVPTSYVTAVNYAKFTDPGSVMFYIQAVVDVVA